MTKDVILTILDNSKDNLMDSFKIGDKEINSIKEITDRDYTSLIEAMESILTSNLNDREKMVAYYLVGYANGVIKVLATEPQI
jgi:hypothetical protein